MRVRFLLSVSFVIACASLYTGCRQDPPAFDLESSGYPDAIGQIILANCAVSGCHNAASAHAAAGLDLSTWYTMFKGDRQGAVVIPYSHEHSTLFLICNTFGDLGSTMLPTMPYNDDPLTREQMVTLRDWINSGAPSRTGEVAFSGNPHRRKYYVTNQGCDVVTAIDEETGLAMRYIPVGADYSIESPHTLRMSPDGQYWYVCFSNGAYLEKHRTSDDALVGRILLGATASAAFGSWNTFAITPDSRHAFVVHWDPNGAGRIAWVDLETMQCLQVYQSSLLNQTHGSCVSASGDTLFVTNTASNYVYRFDVSDPTSPSFDQLAIDGTGVPLNINSDDPHEIALSPDHTKYFVTCSGTNCVRVLNATSDTLMATIPVGIYPVEMSFSQVNPYLYVTCMEDTATYPGKRGSVYIINWQTNAVIGSVYTGHQPHGIAVDDDKGVVAVANRNVVPGGPAPHHSSACAGKNGYLTFIEMTSQGLLSSESYELSVDPYSVLFRP